MGIIIQSIRTTWTKASRGAPQAVLRNSTPELLAFPALEEQPEAYLLENSYSENDSFQLYSSPVKTLNKFQLRELGFELNLKEAHLAIIAWVKPRKGQNLGTLKHNQWAQVISNERVPWEYTWAYYKQVFNIFYGDVTMAQNVTHTQAPHMYHDERNLLI